MKEIIKQEPQNNKAPEKQEATESDVSSSPGFVPNQNRKNNNYNHRNRKRNKK